MLEVVLGALGVRLVDPRLWGLGSVGAFEIQMGFRDILVLERRTVGNSSDPSGRWRRV